MRQKMTASINGTNFRTLPEHTEVAPVTSVVRYSLGCTCTCQDKAVNVVLDTSKSRLLIDWNAI